MTYGQLTRAQTDRLVNHPKFEEYMRILEEKMQSSLRNLERSADA